MRPATGQDLVSVPKRSKGRGKADRRADMTPEECYMDVKDFWLRLSPDARSALMRVPIRQLIVSVPFTPLCTCCGCACCAGHAGTI